MKFVGYFTRAGYALNGDIEITFSTTDKKVVEGVKADKKLNIEVKEYRESRSLNANAYLWVLLEKMAKALSSDKDSLYLLMLEKYGVFTHLVVKPEVVTRVKEEWRTVRELGEIAVNGKKGVQLQCYFGSSTYDTKEMARLIDGVVAECKDLNIETLDDLEIKSLVEAWGK